MTTSRMKLTHPALGTTGGSSLFTSVDNLYKAIGDNVMTRCVALTGLVDGTPQTVTHNLGARDFVWFLYQAADGVTGQQLQLLAKSGTPGYSVVYGAGDNYNTATVSYVSGLADTKSNVFLVVMAAAMGQDAAVAQTTDTIDVSSGSVFYRTLSADTTFAFSNGVAGKSITVILNSSVRKSVAVSFEGMRAAGFADDNLRIGDSEPRTLMVPGGRMITVQLVFSSATLCHRVAHRSAASIPGFSRLVTNFPAGPVVQYGNALYVGGGMTALDNDGPNFNAVMVDPVTSRRRDVPIGKFQGGAVYGSAVFGRWGIFVGDFTAYDGVAVGRVAKVDLLTGELDTTFNAGIGTGADSTVYCVSPSWYSNQQMPSSGASIYIGGDFLNFNGTSRVRVAKLNVMTGVLDTTFDSSAGTNVCNANGIVYAIYPNKFDLSATVFLGGAFTTLGGTTRQRIAKVAATNGVVDTTFNSSSGFTTGSVRAIDQDNTASNIWVGGTFTTYGASTRNNYAKLNQSTAVVDATFDSSGTTTNAGVLGIRIADGCLYIVGSWTTFNSASAAQVLRLNLSTAARDTTFMANMVPQVYNSSGLLNCIMVDTTGVYVGGQAYWATDAALPRRGNLAKFDKSGNLIDTFGPPEGLGGQTPTVFTLALSIHGLVVAGAFGGYCTQRASGVIKIDLLTGEQDTNFAPDFQTSNSSVAQVYDATQQNFVTCLEVDASGVYVGGTFTTVNGFFRKNLVKLNRLTGAVDQTFNPGTGTDSAVNGMMLDGSNGLYICGAFSTYNGTSRSKQAKVNATTGAIDTTYVPPTAGSGINCFKLQGGWLYIGGLFASFNSVSVSRVVRVNPSTGAHDATWTSAAVTASQVSWIDSDGTRLYYAASDNIYFRDISTGAASSGTNVSLSAGGSIYLKVIGTTLWFAATDTAVMSETSPAGSYAQNGIGKIININTGGNHDSTWVPDTLNAPIHNPTNGFGRFVVDTANDAIWALSRSGVGVNGVQTSWQGMLMHGVVRLRAAAPTRKADPLV